jgi:protein SCO1/2
MSEGRWLDGPRLLQLATLVLAGVGLVVLSRFVEEGRQDGRLGYPAFAVETAEGALHLGQHRDQLWIVYFGYVSCPDICPTTLSTAAAAVNLLTEEQQQRVRGVFVSVDPERDDLPRLAEYSRWFHPRFVGGHARDLPAVAARWGVSWTRAPLQDSALGYAVDHSTFATVWGGGTADIDVLQHDSPVEDWVAVLRRRLTAAAPSG